MDRDIYGYLFKPAHEDLRMVELLLAQYIPAHDSLASWARVEMHFNSGGERKDLGDLQVDRFQKGDIPAGIFAEKQVVAPVGELSAVPVFVADVGPEIRTGGENTHRPYFFGLRQLPCTGEKVRVAAKDAFCIPEKVDSFCQIAHLVCVLGEIF